MKNIHIALIMLLIPGFALAGTFNPTPLRIIAPDIITYDFKHNLDIPVTVSGTNAQIVFTVYTFNKGESIGTIRNGYLGWHYVNRIDTCLYVSVPYNCTIGLNTIYWDGTDSYGSVLPSGEYTYYICGYDNVTERQRVTTLAINIDRQCVMPLEYDESGAPLNPPKLLSQQRFSAGGIPENYVRLWTLGNDPETNSQLETCDFHESWQSGTVTTWGYHQSMPWALNNFDHTIVYHCQQNQSTHTKALFKSKWVPNGDAIRDEEWGQNLRWSYCDWQGGGALSVPGEELILCEGFSKYGTVPESWSWIVDFNGNQLAEFENEWFIDRDKFTAGLTDSPNYGPEFMSADGFGKFYYADLNYCIQLCFNPIEYLIQENYHDMDIWVNGNGDLYYDFNWTGEFPTWLCNYNNTFDYRSRSIYSEKHGFMSRGVSGLGGISGLLFGPDGRGLMKYSWADESIADYPGPGMGEGIFFINNGSAYDGAYKDFSNQAEYYQGIWYSAFDFFKGKIEGTNNNLPAVDAVTPLSFSVNQNSPNPLNTMTAISFTIPEENNVTVDIFNVAGQKVTTLINSHMNAGTHTVVWDATHFSAGVYFYTVRSGKFSQTKKMTLLK